MDDLSHLTTGRDEMNFAEFPIALLSDRAGEGQNILEFQDTVWDKGAAVEVTRKLTVRGANGLGLPTALDADVLIGLIQLTKVRNDFTERKVHFSRYELVKFLGWPDKGSSYKRVKESFDRWMGVYLSYEKAWWDNKHKSWVDEKFHIIDNATFYERDRPARPKGQNELPFSSFTWNEVVFRSFGDGFLKKLDIDFFLGLDTSIAKQMYRYLDKHFFHNSRLEYDLEKFAFEHVGLSRNYHTGKIKEKLAPAIRELEEKQFLEPLPPSERFRQIRRGHWEVIFVQHQAQRSKAAASKAIKGREATPLERELIERGITPATATEFVSTYAHDRIMAQIEVFDTLVARKDRRVSRNPAGFLYRAIQKDFQKPKDVETPAEKQERDRAKSEAKARAEKARADAEARDKARYETERAPIDEHWRELSDREKADLEKEAFKNADRFLKERFDKAKQMGSMMAPHYRQSIIDKQIRKNLGIAEQSSKPE